MARSPWAQFVVAGGGAALLTLFLPWWDDLNGLGVETNWPKVAALASLGLIAAGIYLSKRPRLATPVLAAAVILLVSLIGFFVQADNTEHFGQVPFSDHVRFGFFICIGGWGTATIGAIGAMLAAAPPLRFDD